MGASNGNDSDNMRSNELSEKLPFHSFHAKMSRLFCRIF